MIAAGRVEWPLDLNLRELARSEGVLPFLLWLAGDQGQLRPQAALHLARRPRLTRLLDLLASEGVQAVVFKGASLAQTHYPDPALRPHVDTDLLIDERNVDAARGVFERSGHRLLPHVTGRFVTSQFHYVDGETGGGHTYDVHWRIADPAVFRRLLPFSEVRAHAVAIDVFGANGFAPSIPHALVMAAVHRVAHHANSDRLIWLLDMRLLLRAASSDHIDEFCLLADAAGVNAICHDACVRTADMFGDVDVPALLARRGASACEPTRAYLNAPSPLKRIWLDLQALGWRDRAAFLREHVLPPASYMQATSPSRAPLPWKYASRLALGLRDWIRN